MIPNNNLSILPFYTSLEKQNHRKDYAYGNIFCLPCPDRKIIPFQIIRETSLNPITSVLLKTLSGTTFLNITANMVSTGLSVWTNSTDGYDVIIYPGILPMAITTPEGRYYVEITDGVNTWYSEVFTIIRDLSQYLKIEYYDNENLEFQDGAIEFASGFKFQVYLPTQLGRPEYTFEDETTKRDGYEFSTKQISEKTFKFNFIAPEYLCDAMRVIRLMDNVTITSKGDIYTADSFLITPEWQEDGYLAGVNAEFQCDTVLKKTAKGFVPTLTGDYNDDFDTDPGTPPLPDDPIVSSTYEITLSASDGTVSGSGLDASGGTSVLTVVGTITNIHESSAITYDSFVPALAISGTGFYISEFNVIAQSRGIQIGDERSCIVTASYPDTTSKVITIYQKLNQVESISLAANCNPLTFSAGANTGTLTASLRSTYSSLAYSDNDVTSSSTFASAEAWATVTGASVSIASRKNVLGSLRQCLITASYSGASDATVLISQVANTIISSGFSIQSSISSIPYAGAAVDMTGNLGTIYASGYFDATDVTSSTVFSSDEDWAAVTGDEVLVEDRYLNPGPARSVTITGTYSGDTDEVTLTQVAYVADCELFVTPSWDTSNIGAVDILIEPQNLRNQELDITIGYTDINGVSGKIKQGTLLTTVGATLTISITDCGSIDSLSVDPTSDMYYNYFFDALHGAATYISYSAATIEHDGQVIIRASLPWSLELPSGLLANYTSGGGYGALSRTVIFNNTGNTDLVAVITWVDSNTQDITVHGHPLSNIEVIYNATAYHSGDVITLPSGSDITIESDFAWTGTLIEGTGSITPASGNGALVTSNVIGLGGAGSYKAIFTIQSEIDVIALQVT